MNTLHPSIKGYQLLLYRKTDQDMGYKDDHPVVSCGAPQQLRL
jgi:hypothetical protein